MIVYILIEEYDSIGGYNIIGVYSTYERAIEEKVRRYKKDAGSYEIEECELNKTYN